MTHPRPRPRPAPSAPGRRAARWRSEHSPSRASAPAVSRPLHREPDPPAHAVRARRGSADARPRPERHPVHPGHAAGGHPGQARRDRDAGRSPNQFGEERDAVLFAPGHVRVGRQPADLPGRLLHRGRRPRPCSPGDVVINGAANVYNQCTTATTAAELHRAEQLLALDVQPHHQPARAARAAAPNTEFWAVSQAAPLRRVRHHGHTSLMDYCTDGPQYASGGYLADARTKAVTNGSQQQWLTRNSEIGSWSNGVWNQTFSGVEGAPAQSFPAHLSRTPRSARHRPARRSPTSTSTPAVRGRSSSPQVRYASVGASWTDGSTRGTSLPLSTLLRRASVGLGEDHREAAGHGPATCSSPPASTASTARCTSAGRAPCSSASASPP